MKKNSVALWCCAGVGLNLILFVTKLYVGLTVNSISIFSDAMNNLADTLSCVVSAACIFAVGGLAKKGLEYACSKAEQLLSFVLSLIVALVGAGFAYSSAERLMYPTPVWFSAKYFAVILFTAVVKLVMFFLLRHAEKSTGSSVIRVMKADSLLDFCITGVTLISFTLTRYTEFTVDAVCGLVISVIITVQAVILVRSCVLSLIDLPDLSVRSSVDEVLAEYRGRVRLSSVRFTVDGGKQVTAYLYLKASDGESADELALDIINGCKEKAGITARLIFE